jgi:hypothetical protein
LPAGAVRRRHRLSRTLRHQRSKCLYGWRPRAGSKRARAAITVRSVQLSRGPGVRRCSTAG